MANEPSGTILSLPPLPRSFTVAISSPSLDVEEISKTLIPINSLTRAPVPYKSSNKARSRNDVEMPGLSAASIIKII